MLLVAGWLGCMPRLPAAGTAPASAAAELALFAELPYSSMARWCGSAIWPAASAWASSIRASSIASIPKARGPPCNQAPSRPEILFLCQSHIHTLKDGCCSGTSILAHRHCQDPYLGNDGPVALVWTCNCIAPLVDSRCSQGKADVCLRSVLEVNLAARIFNCLPDCHSCRSPVSSDNDSEACRERLRASKESAAYKVSSLWAVACSQLDSRLCLAL